MKELRNILQSNDITNTAELDKDKVYLFFMSREHLLAAPDATRGLIKHLKDSGVKALVVQDDMTSKIYEWDPDVDTAEWDKLTSEQLSYNIKYIIDTSKTKDEMKERVTNLLRTCKGSEDE